VDTVHNPAHTNVDAIIVPTGRPAGHLTSAMNLARYHDCTLVTISSLNSRAEEVRALAEKMGVADVIAVDSTEIRKNVVPDFATTDLLRDTKFHRDHDTSHKRNFGLLLARMIGWDHVVFLDDDIRIPDPHALSGAVGSLGRFASVGLTIEGYPDNSVVCHAYRMVGGRQDTFIGGGALAVGVESFNSFFPNIYNDDWFFLLNDRGLRPSAFTTGVGEQSQYDPFRAPARAQSEELGDSLGEGLYMLLDNTQRLDAANYTYWSRFMLQRGKFIDEIVTFVGDTALPPEDKARMIESLKAAKGRNQVIDPQLCVDYLEAWRLDRKLWRDHISTTPEQLGRDKALAELGLIP
jgi:glycosyltransferase involved in cell wall biosynthesis